MCLPAAGPRNPARWESLCWRRHAGGACAPGGTNSKQAQGVATQVSPAHKWHKQQAVARGCTPHRCHLCTRGQDSKRMQGANHKGTTCAARSVAATCRDDGGQAVCCILLRSVACVFSYLLPYTVFRQPLWVAYQRATQILSTVHDHHTW